MFYSLTKSFSYLANDPTDFRKLSNLSHEQEQDHVKILLVISGRATVPLSMTFSTLTISWRSGLD